MKLLINLFSAVESFCGKLDHFTEILDLFGADSSSLVHSKDDYYSQLGAAEFLICWNFRESDYEKAPNLNYIVTPAAGRDWIAEDPRGQVKVFFSSFHGPMIAESAMAMLTYSNNQFAKQKLLQKKKEWNRNACSNRALLRNQKLLIWGCGSIGKHCGELFQAIGMEVAGVSRSGLGEFSFPIVKTVDSGDLLENADHVLCLLPGAGDNKKVLEEDFFAKMKKGASFYNFGRGTVVDEKALISALDSGQLSFAGLDVTYKEPLAVESRLYTHEKVLLTPHNSCTYNEYLYLFSEELCSRIRQGEIAGHELA